MATAVKQPPAGLVRTHLVVGWPEQVRAALERARVDGRLVRVGEVIELADRQVQVTAQLREDRPRRFEWLPRLAWPSARVWARIAAGVLAVAAVAGVVWAVVAAVSALVAAVSAAVSTATAWVSTYWPALAGIAVVLLLLGGAGGAKKCVGLHCGGCRR
jgi:energy-converting hydrogenase Eha subunit A